MATTTTPLLRDASYFERELRKVRARIEKRDAAQDADRTLRNQLIYEACTAGLTERKAAKAAGVSYGYAGRARRAKGRPVSPGPGARQKDAA